MSPEEFEAYWADCLKQKQYRIFLMARSLETLVDMTLSTQSIKWHSMKRLILVGSGLNVHGPIQISECSRAAWERWLPYGKPV